MEKNDISQRRAGLNTCAAPEDIAALLLEEQVDCEPTALAAHLENCGECGRVAEELRHVLATLRAGRHEAPVRDLSDAVMAEIHSDAAHAPMVAARSNFTWRGVFKYAAAILAVVGCTLIFLTRGGAPGRSVELAVGSLVGDALVEGVNWLVANQQDDGSWDVAALGGEPRYAPALNGLALLALTRSESRGEAVAEAVSKSVAHLLSQQSEEGAFGSIFDRALYNHGIATLALLSAYRQTADAQLREPISKALAHMRDRQSYVGGWGYQGLPITDANNSVTAWQVQSLLLAEELKISDVRADLRQALEWMSGTVDTAGTFRYGSTVSEIDGDPQNLTMMGAYCLLSAKRVDFPVEERLMQRIANSLSAAAETRPTDYYAAFFYAAALNEADRSEFQVNLEGLKSFLLAKQERDGPSHRSWQADDRWGRAGGQLYSTSLSLLALSGI